MAVPMGSRRENCNVWELNFTRPILNQFGGSLKVSHVSTRVVIQGNCPIFFIQYNFPGFRRSMRFKFLFSILIREKGENL
ncbi:hypothetical protein CDL12_07500 [Handroanthus impetiginosus]|uniref:Uncharacterized protein n=1 Tax=Handroanthus impetiginosus TaxID=429701 RepID=A0A2G9HQK8_9LAMI|nr:hypothetical protein CDL12_07500 [Handroanthus impetiginosus]